MPEFWITKALNMPLVLNKPEFWICQCFLNMPLVLNLPMFWIYQGSEYVRVHRVLKMSEYAWLCLAKYAWICLNMLEYAWICLNLSEPWMAFVLYFPFVVPCLLERIVTYFKVYTKLQVLVWRKMRLFSWRHKIWCSCKYFIWFLF